MPCSGRLPNIERQWVGTSLTSWPMPSFQVMRTSRITSGHGLKKRRPWDNGRWAGEVISCHFLKLFSQVLGKVWKSGFRHVQTEQRQSQVWLVQKECLEWWLFQFNSKMLIKLCRMNEWIACCLEEWCCNEEKKGCPPPINCHTVLSSANWTTILMMWTFHDETGRKKGKPTLHTHLHQQLAPVCLLRVWDVASVKLAESPTSWTLKKRHYCCREPRAGGICWFENQLWLIRWRVFICFHEQRHAASKEIQHTLHVWLKRPW